MIFFMSGTGGVRDDGRGSEGPEDGHDQYGDEEGYDVERQTDAHEVGKAVVAHALHNEVGLVADGRAEAG